MKNAVCHLCGEPTDPPRIEHRACQDRVRRAVAHYMLNQAAPTPSWLGDETTLLGAEFLAVLGLKDAWRLWATGGLRLPEGRALRDRLEQIPLLYTRVQKYPVWPYYLMAERLAAIRWDELVPGDVPNPFAFKAPERPLYITGPSVVYQLHTPTMAHHVSKKAQLGFTDHGLYIAKEGHVMRLRWDELEPATPWDFGFVLRPLESAVRHHFTLQQAWFYHALIADIQDPNPRRPVVVPEFGRPSPRALRVVRAPTG